MSRDSATETSALMTAADWLGGVFAAPPEAELVEAYAAPAGRDALARMGEWLNAREAARALDQALTREAPAALAVTLQRRYTALFEGIFPSSAVLPYESAWQPGADGTVLGGTPVTEMEATLRELDLHVSSECCEPADHLSIELAALAMALRDGQKRLARALIRRLQGWVPAFCAALSRRDSGGLYAAAGDLLLALIRESAAALEREEAPAAERFEGEFA
ncbi:TorD/DmsD family molecular chaperone [Halomonas piscis]|uniref:TorD/DmsD family molecular chaperone n=1 Tax=Halomonas piscis TaxID=3031727 RepID=UPI00289DFEB1|nr:molecular chaperone TorD family protein [Halomonas piscis]